MWKTRIVHEAMCWESNLFVTFQYRDDALPASLSLEYRDFQLFLKRLRARLSGERELSDGRRPIRYFVCGEYGGKSFRPHWHAVLFNTVFPDARFWNSARGKVGRSELAEELWTHGHVDIGILNSRRAAYVAGYVHKKARARAQPDVIDYRTGEVFERRPEFHRQSNDPGLGSYWYDRYGGDLFPLDGAIVDGKRHKVPRYYWNKKQLSSSEAELEEIRRKRLERAALVPEEESSLERRAAREEAALLRHSAFGARGN